MASEELVLHLRALGEADAADVLEGTKVAVAADWRAALYDALGSHNVSSGDVVAEFETLIDDPAYQHGE